MLGAPERLTAFGAPHNNTGIWIETVVECVEYM
jgi:hypothetical protein